MLQDVAALHHPQFAPQGVVCELRCVGNIWVAGNAPELREVVTNLVTNAVQAMPDGGTLTLACDSRGDGTAWFSVRDTGIGMPPPVAARACEPFFSTKGGMGTGLGLAVSYQIIHRHGGTLAIDSTEGAGTTISADLPAVAAPTSPVASVAQSGPPLRILFVEDHPDIAEMLTHMLRRLGHGTVHAATVEEGARLCAETRPDLVITDFAVGDAFGDVVAHAAAMLAPPIPVILISGSAQPAEGHEHLYAAVLQKPVLMEIVQSAIQYVLAR
jgi:CheY-like chemotaxis protein